MEMGPLSYGEKVTSLRIAPTVTLAPQSSASQSFPFVRLFMTLSSSSELGNAFFLRRGEIHFRHCAFSGGLISYHDPGRLDSGDESRNKSCAIFLLGHLYIVFEFNGNALYSKEGGRSREERIK